MIARVVIVCAALAGTAAADLRDGVMTTDTGERIGVSISHETHVDRVPSGTTAHAVVGAGVQRTSRSGRALYHPTGCVNFQLDERGTATLENEWEAVEAAFAAWETASSTMACGGVKFTTQIVTDPPDARDADGVNTIHFRDGGWTHSPDAVGVTRVLYVDEPSSPRDGEILEVDMDINAAGFTLATDGRANAIDLQAAVTHEVGHALGLDHNCGVENGAWPSDRDGTPVPSCESVSTDLANATMYVQVAPGDTNMRTPKASDTAGLCDSVGGTCTSEVSGGCAAGGNKGGFIIGLVLVALRRRKR